MIEADSFLLNQIATCVLIDFYRREESFEVSRSEALVVLSLDDLAEEGGSVLHGFGEDLQKVSLFIVVNQDFKLLDNIEILLDFGATRGQLDSQVVIVGIWDGQKNAPSFLHASDGINDVVSSDGNVLNTWASIEVNILLDL
jgi:hypothetical protein